MKIRYFLSAALMSIGSLTFSQNLNSAYFLDGYAYGHELNPAKEYDRSSYFSIPFLPGNMYFSTRGNLALTDFLYKNPNGSGLITALHPSISAEEALSKFHANNKILGDLRYDIFSVGFHTKRAYHTITLGLRTNFGTNIPYDLFRVAKQLENRNYSFGNLGITATSWLEAGYSYSRNINEAIRVGGKFKFLIGGGYADVKMDNLSLNLESPGEWTATANATAEVGIKNFTWGETETKEYKSRPGTYEKINFNNADIDKPGINGFGAAFDLGAEWDLGKQGWVDGLKVGIAILDIGFIKWKDVSTAQNKGEEFRFHFDELKVKNSEGKELGEQFDDVSDRLSDLISMQEGGTTSKSKMLGATLNLSAEYKMPFYPQLKAGLLSTTRIQGKYSWNEERLALTVSPVKWFEISGNVGVGTTGLCIGWVFNIHPRGFNLFAGMDYSIYRMTKQYIPKSCNSNICFGINFPIGKSRVEYSKKE